MEKVLKNLFWDSNFEKIDYQKNASTVIERILDLGDIEQIKVMLKHYDTEKIKQVLRTSRRLTPKSANFWADYFKVRKEDVLCLSNQSSRAQENNWPY